MSDAGPRQAGPYSMTAGVGAGLRFAAAISRAAHRFPACVRMSSSVNVLDCGPSGRGLQEMQAQQWQFLHGDLILADQQQIGSDDKLPSAAVLRLQLHRRSAARY